MGKRQKKADDKVRFQKEFTAANTAIRKRQVEIDRLEHEISSRVNEAYGLTDDDEELLRRTAPPRSPVSKGKQ